MSYFCKDAKGCRKRAEKLSAVKARERQQMRDWRDSDLRSMRRARQELER